MTRLFVVEQSALAPGGHYYAYTRCVVAAAQEAGLDVTILQNRRFKSSWQLPGVTAIPAFTHTWSEAAHLWIHTWGPGNLAYEIVEATRFQPPIAGDHVLVHTMSYAELRNLLDYLGDLPLSSDQPFYHLLLRYDPDVLENSLEVYKPLFDRIAVSPRLRQFAILHTDTDLLSDAFTNLTGLPFNTLPIPFMQDRLKQRLASEQPRDPSAPLTVTYLGDARWEKNYAALPAALQRLWPEFGETGRVRFVLQSNFNTPGGEVGIMAAVQRLAQFPARYVELIHNPMDYEEYYDRLAQADIVVIPYSAERYRLRSSGVLIEAMAAGKPIVTTARSWMETQVDDTHSVLCDDVSDLGASLETLLRSYDRYRAGALAISPRMIERSSGAHFVSEMLARADNASQVASATGPRILVVMDGDAAILRNGASRVAASQLQYLARAGYQLCGLFLTNGQNLDIDQIEAWTTALKQEIAPFALDVSFVVGPGRLSTDTRRQRMLRSDYSFSIAGSLAKVAAFDVSLDLVEYLTTHPIDAVLVNYVLNLPLIDRLGLAERPIICEVVDIQSFQKAIYGDRPVTAEDLDQEFALLARCDYLISLNPVETAYIRERLPDIPIATSGIFCELRQASFGDLSLCQSVADIVYSCGPANPALRLSTSWKGEPGDGTGLSSLEAIDLVYVSSAHKANVSGLRWFLDNVYGPHLAPASVSMIIAGNIVDAGDWPSFPNVHFVGRLETIAPLYAAGKVVVLPIIEGAGMPVKTAEALSYGRPIVATGVALRGLEGDMGGVIVADEPALFASAIRKLLTSADMRREYGAAAHETALRVANPNRYIDLMNTALSHVLGARSRPIEPDAMPSLETEELVEWDEVVRSVNRVVWRWLACEPIDGATILDLARQPPRRVQAVLRQVMTSLVEERQAPILRADTGVSKRVMAIHRKGAKAALKELVDVLGAHMTMSGGPEGGQVSRGHTGSARRTVDLVTLASLPVDIAVTGTNGGDGIRIDGHSIGQAVMQERGRKVLRTRSAALPDRHYGFAVRKVEFYSGLGALGSLTATQVLSLKTPIEVHGTPLLTTNAGVVPTVPVNGSLALRIPLLFSSSEARLFVDIVCIGADEAEIDVEVEGRPIPLDRLRDEDLLIFRFEFPLQARSEIPWAADLFVTAFDQSVSLQDVRLHLVVAADLETELAGFDAGKRSRSVGHDLLAISASASQGKPFRRAAGALLHQALSPPDRMADVATLTAVLAQELSATANHAPVLQSAGALVPLIWPSLAIDECVDTMEAGAAAIVVGEGLTFDVEASFPVGSSQGHLCLVDGYSLTREDAAGGMQVWRRPGSPIARSQRLHRIAWQTVDGRAITPQKANVVCRLYAGLDPVTDRKFLQVSNIYDADTWDGTPTHFWTGPGLVARLALPLAIARPSRLHLRVIDLGALRRPEELSVRCNGRRLQPSILREESIIVLDCDIMPVRGDPAVCEIELVIPRAYIVPGEPRRLGVAIQSVTLVMELPVP